MTWREAHERRAVLTEVVRRTGAGTAPFPFADVDGAVEHFGTPAAVLLALQHRWSVHLAARLDGATPGPDGVRAARTEAATALPELRRFLDAQLPHYEERPDVRAALRAEERMVAEHTPHRVQLRP